jgi:Zn-dependent peptidase ImmA (M78 family)/transcriptional regulator with XRE-family HTH domain
MMSKEELGWRLRLARERAGITQGEAGQALNLDDTAVAKIERGRRRLGALELKRLASLYRTSVEELLEDNPSEIEVPLKIALRAGTEALGPKAEVMKRRLQRIVADDRWLREREGEDTRSPAFSTVTVSGNARGFHKGYEAAETFRDRYGLGASPIADVAILADEVGVVVARMPLGDNFDSPDGCSAVDPDSGASYILINSDKPRVRRRFTIAHELGHLALGHLLGGQIIVDETVGGKSPEEKQANAFAAGLLMPTEGVQGAVKRLKDRLGAPPNPLEWIVWLAASFGVSEQAAAYRLINLRLVRVIGGTSAEAVQEMAENREITGEARARFGLSPVTVDVERGAIEVGPSMRVRVARALSQGTISVERAAGMLHQPPEAVYRWLSESGIHLSFTEAPR